jgi:hypothetical protein
MEAASVETGKAFQARPPAPDDGPDGRAQIDTPIKSMV